MPLTQANLGALFENAPQAIIISDAGGAIVYANAQAGEMFGYRPHELPGKPIEILVPKHLRQAHEQHRLHYALHPFVRSMGRDLGLVARRKDGTEFPVEIGLSIVDADQQRPLVASFITDLTQYRRDEQELLQVNARLKRRTRQLTALHEIGHTLAATLDLGEIYRVMFREIVQGLLNTTNLVVALYDQEAETIFCGFAIVDNLEMDPSKFPPIPLGEGPVSDTIRTRAPRILDLQPVMSQLEAQGRGVLVGNDTRPKSALYMPMIGGDSLVGVMQVQHFEVDGFRETDLQLLSILASQAAVAITNAQLYAQAQDRAQALAQALAQQQELDRLKDELIQNVSHELRTPLGIVQGYAELLESGVLGELQPRQKEPASIIVRRVRMLRKLVDHFTTFVEVEADAPQPESIDLASLVSTLLEDFQIAARQAQLTLEAEIAPNLAPMVANPLHIHQVLDNLISNALKFTPAGGQINVRLWQEEAQTILEVADTGIGIPPDQVKRIFERFYQVDGSMSRRHGGTGLGLALVQQIIHAHSGQITVRTTPGQGATFRVTLPHT